MANKKNKSKKPIETYGLPMILRKKQVLEMVGLSSSTVRNLQSVGAFPKPIHLSLRATGWLTTDIENWLAQRVAERAA
jgi:prophage regulatory protein